ncbi:hypothetical protein GB928_027670 [Shinella curvata]|uniref:Uncharacterized protein n=1 Tax=Shinella curvata TaxID=1817964 RepID=A0ABT8XML0_9HYPH|nr:hypothetical protein [Shinella curvata]MCJ8057186.1 hypothetical protein [Shinella curvata]MDO6124967.1 hypothetical protein [Shinella curvata]
MDLTDTSSAISQIADFLDDDNRERFLEVLCTALESAEDFMVSVREMASSSRVFAKPCLELCSSRFVLDEYHELYERPPSNTFRKLVVMEGFEDMTALEIAGLILTDEPTAFTALLKVGLATRAIADLGGDDGRLVIFYQKAGDFLVGLRDLYRLEQ